MQTILSTSFLAVNNVFFAIIFSDYDNHATKEEESKSDINEKYMTNPVYLTFSKVITLRAYFQSKQSITSP